MAVQKILQAGNTELRKQAKPVQNYDKRIEKLIKDLEETLTFQHDPEGVGLAAPQIGVCTRLFIFKPQKESQVFINPEITWMSEETNDPKKVDMSRVTGDRKKKTQKTSEEYIMEGCLSLPHYYGPVQRAKSIKVRYQKPKLENGKWKMVNVKETLTGLPAQIVQHEVAHLNGKLFIDDLLEQKRKLYHWTGKDWEEVELP